jgi:hypothetical protein
MDAMVCLLQIVWSLKVEENIYTSDRSVAKNCIELGISEKEAYGRYDSVTGN